MSLTKKCYFILPLLLLGGLSQMCAAQILIGKENDSSWMEKEIPSEVLARKKFTLKRRLTQNLLTRFNSYYNAHTRLESIVQSVAESHVDNYDSLLTLYPNSPEDFNALKGNLDSVIFDASYGIEIHDPRSKWIDNLYLIAGQAYYFEQDYANAIAAFRHVIKHYGSKTKENTPEVIGGRGYTARQQISVATQEKKKLFYHRPSRNDAFVWLVRSYIDSGLYDLAGSLLSTLQADPVFPVRLKPEVLAMQSRFYFRQQLVDKGISILAKAAAKEEDKALKARWNFILGQYYQQKKDWEKAVHYYAYTDQLRPGPLMRFYARLNIIDVHIQQDSVNYTSGMEDMLAMARREKYELYRSVIYYHLAKNALAFHHPLEAVAYLQKGLLYNTENTLQKLKNYYLLAGTLYETGRYGPASVYYDSTAMIMDAGFTHQDEVVVRKAALARLMVQRDIVDRQDSLQHLAALPAADLQAYLEAIVSDSMKARRKRNLFLQESAANDRGALASIRGGQSPDANQPGSGKNDTWYFYNTALKAKGFSLFRNEWGKRLLADNWRTGTQSAVNSGVATNLPHTAAPDSLLAMSPADSAGGDQLKLLMAPIPLSAAQKKQSDDSIMQALYAEASIFSDELGNDTAARNTLSLLLSRFPGNPDLAGIYYRLHLINTNLGQTAEANRYKQLLLEKFPTSKYNAALSKPQQPTETYAEKVTTKLYETAYMAYLDGDYAQVQPLKDSAQLVAPDNPQRSRFDLLAAMTYIKQHPGNDTGKLLLKQIIDAGKADSAITNQAQAILNALDRKRALIEHLAHLQLPVSPEDTLHSTSEPVRLLQPDTAVAVKAAPAAPLPVKPATPDTLAATTPVPKPAPPVTPYAVNQKDSYFVVLSFHHTDAKVIRESQEKFVAFNMKHYAGAGIEVSTYLIDGRVILIFRLFPDEMAALKYYEDIKKKAAVDIVPQLPKNYYDLFIISRDNFILLNNTKDFSGYMKFFSENYR